MFYHVKKDLQFIVDSDPAARNKIELFLLYPSIHAMIMYRMSHFFYTKKRCRRRHKAGVWKNAECEFESMFT